MTTRSRRSCLSVPGSSRRMIEKAATSPADEVFLDLEDGVAVSEKASARNLVVETLASLGFGDKIVAVRVNDVTTPFCYRDVVEIVSRAGDKVDCLIIPKVQKRSHVHFLDHLLAGLEAELGLGRRIGIEVQIETARGAVHLREISRASNRVEAVVFGPGDYAADLGVPQLEVGALEADYPGHQWHWAMSAIVNHARAVGAQAVDGPYSDFRDRAGYLESARRARLLGFDGKWCIHPSQVEWANEAFSPTPEEYEYAARILQAYREASEAGRGAAELDGKMIDEASRKMAERVAARARAAGLA